MELINYVFMQPIIGLTNSVFLSFLEGTLALVL